MLADVSLAPNRRMGEHGRMTRSRRRLVITTGVLAGLMLASGRCSSDS
jgi:hypothetical protein